MQKALKELEKRKTILLLQQLQQKQSNPRLLDNMVSIKDYSRKGERKKKKSYNKEQESAQDRSDPAQNGMRKIESSTARFSTPEKTPTPLS